MANSPGSLNGNLIAQAGLELLLTKYPVLGQIASDFSSEPIKKGQSVITRIPSLVGVQDWSDSDGYTPTGVVSTDVTISVNKFKHASVEITDSEYSATDRNLTLEFAEQAFPAIGAALMADVAALWTSGNYANATTCPVASGTYATAIIDPVASLADRNAEATFAVFNPSLYFQVLKDQVVTNLNFNGVGANSNQVGVLAGVKPSLYNSLPSLSQNLIGVVGHKSAIAIATRVPSDAGADDLPLAGKISVVTDPKSGLSVQVRESYDFRKGRRYITFALIYGVAVGNAAALQRIKSA